MLPWSAHDLGVRVLPALLLAGAGTAAPPPTPLATLRLPSADADQPTGPVWVGFDPAGRYLAAYRVTYRDPLLGEKAYLAVWDAAHWKVAHDEAVDSVFAWPEFGPPAAFLPSGSHLMYLASWAARGHPLGAARGQLLAFAPVGKIPERPRVVTASLWTDPAAKELTRLAVAEDWTVTTWGASAEKPTAFVERNTVKLPGEPTALALSPDHARLAWAERPPIGPPDYDEAVVTVHVLDLKTKKALGLKTGEPTYDVSRLAFSPDGKKLAAGHKDGRVRVWDLAAEKETAVFRGPLLGVHALAFSPDGSLLAYGTGEAKGGGNAWVVSVKDGKHLAAWAADRAGVVGVTFDPKGEWLAVAGWEKVIKVYDVKQVLKGR